MKTIPDHILLGYVIGVHGVRGWVKLHSECRPREQIFQYKEYVLRNEHNQESFKLKLLSSRTQSKGLVAQFDGYNDRDSAYQLINHSLWVHQNQLPALPEGEFYWHHLLGLKVINLANEYLGQISSLFETGANDVMVVKADKQEILIPFIMHYYILNIDIAAGSMTVDWDKEWSDLSDKL